MKKTDAEEKLAASGAHSFVEWRRCPAIVPRPPAAWPDWAPAWLELPLPFLGVVGALAVAASGAI